MKAPVQAPSTFRTVRAKSAPASLHSWREPSPSTSIEVDDTYSNGILHGVQAGRVEKAAQAFRERRESLATLEQLKDIVPTIPARAPVSQLELLQHVIDYICHLQQQLARPGAYSDADDDDVFSDDEDERRPPLRSLIASFQSDATNLNAASPAIATQAKLLF